MTALLAASGQSLSAQWPLVAGPLAVAALVAAALFRRGAPGPRPERWARQAARIPNALEQLTGIPGWAAAVVATGLFAPVLSVVGFYTDVSWHVDFGRDKVLFTPPHTMIVAGLALIPISAALGVVFATITGARVGFRWGFWRVPWSTLPLAAFGTAAFVGFPLDSLWHASYGVDVTLWSPTHLLMVGAGGLSTISLWLTLREAGVGPRDSRWATATYWVLAGATLVRLSTFQDEFDLGVPQFQQLFHPVIISLAAGVGLVAARIVLGRGGAIVMVIGFLVLRAAIALLTGPALGYTVPRFPLYLGSAVAVEGAAAAFGTERRGRFAVAAGVGMATIGLAVEWWWSHVWGRQPWSASLLPEALALAAVAAVAAAILGAAAGSVAAGERARLSGPVLAAAAVAVLVTLVVPSPRTGADLAADVSLDRRGDEAVVTVDLDRPEAAEGAHWFDAVSWQGGGTVITPMTREGPGRWVSEDPVPITGDWKTIVRLHEGTRLLGLAVYLPEDPEIDAPLIPAENGRRRFVVDTELLLREVKDGPPATRLFAYGVIAAAAALCTWLVALTARRSGRSARHEPAAGRRTATAATAR